MRFPLSLCVFGGFVAVLQVVSWCNFIGLARKKILLMMPVNQALESGGLVL